MFHSVPFPATQHVALVPLPHGLHAAPEIKVGDAKVLLDITNTRREVRNRKRFREADEALVEEDDITRSRLRKFCVMASHVIFSFDLSIHGC